MSILTRWLLIPPVNARLIGRYRDYRRHGASAFSATLGCFWMILAWIFIPLEHPRWQRIRAEHKNLYPHINASRPRPLDPVRYLIQTCWLLIGASRKETPKPRRRAFSGLQNIRGRYHQWMNELPERVSHKTQHLDEKKELGHLSAGARRLILGIIVTFSLILALICVTQPFNPLAQFIFLMLLWGVALIVRVDCAGARLLPGSMAAESSAGAIAERYVAVAVGGYLCPDLQRRSQRGEKYHLRLAGYRLAER